MLLHLHIAVLNTSLWNVSLNSKKSYENWNADARKNNIAYHKNLSAPCVFATIVFVNSHASSSLQRFPRQMATFQRKHHMSTDKRASQVCSNTSSLVSGAWERRPTRVYTTQIVVNCLITIITHTVTHVRVRLSEYLLFWFLQTQEMNSKCCSFFRNRRFFLCTQERLNTL